MKFMNNKCNLCARFLTCNGKNCNKITFVEAGILDKPKMIKKNTDEIVLEAIRSFGKSIYEASYIIQTIGKKSF